MLNFGFESKEVWDSVNKAKEEEYLYCCVNFDEEKLIEN